MDFLYIVATILFTVYGQLIVKWQVSKAGLFPVSTAERLGFLFRLVFNPWILSALAASFLALLSWMAAMTKFQLSYAYPFMSLAFVLVLFMSAVLFHEGITLPKLLGLGFIVIGIVIGSRE